MPGSLLGQVRNSLVIECLRACESRGIETAGLLERIGLDPSELADPHGTVDFKSAAEIMEQAAEGAGQSDLALDLVGTFTPGASGIIGRLLLSAATVREGLDTTSRYARLLVSHVEATLVPDSQGGATFVFDYPPSMSVRREQIDLFLMGALVLRIRRAAGDDWCPLSAELPHRSRIEPAVLRRWFGPRLRSGGERCVISIDAQTLALPMPDADPALFALMCDLGERWLKDMVARPSIVVATRQAIEHLLQTGTPEFAEVASHLQVSPGALKRKLDRAGSGFERILDETRSDLAETLLKTTDKRMVEIAQDLGFSDQAAFSRAATRWFGQTPSSVRRQSMTIDDRPSRPQLAQKA